MKSEAGTGTGMTIVVDQEKITVTYEKGSVFLENIVFHDDNTDTDCPLCKVIQRTIGCVKIEKTKKVVCDLSLPVLSVWSSAGIRYDIKLWSFDFSIHIESAPEGLDALFREYEEGNDEELFFLDEKNEFLCYRAGTRQSVVPNENSIRKESQGKYVFTTGRLCEEETAYSFKDAAIRYLDSFIQKKAYRVSMNAMHGVSGPPEDRRTTLFVRRV